MPGASSTPGYWLVKSDPDDYGWIDLERDARTLWDGVTHPLAQRHLRTMRSGDWCAFYETGSVRAAVGIARVEGAPRPDPEDPTGRRVAVPIAARKQLSRAVTLAELREEPLFRDSPLLRQGRLSVVPLTRPQWERLLELSRT